jgi:hypothetical protein
MARRPGLGRWILFLLLALAAAATAAMVAAGVLDWLRAPPTG